MNCFTITEVDTRNSAAVAAWALERMTAWENERRRLEQVWAADLHDKGFATGKARAFREVAELLLGRSVAEPGQDKRTECADAVSELCPGLSIAQREAIGASVSPA